MNNHPPNDTPDSVLTGEIPSISAVLINAGILGGPTAEGSDDPTPTATVAGFCIGDSADDMTTVSHGLALAEDVHIEVVAGVTGIRISLIDMTDASDEEPYGECFESKFLDWGSVLHAIVSGDFERLAVVVVPDTIEGIE